MICLADVICIGGLYCILYNWNLYWYKMVGVWIFLFFFLGEGFFLFFFVWKIFVISKLSYDVHLVWVMYTRCNRFSE